MVQHHMLGLLYHVHKNNCLAFNKIISKVTQHSLKSSFAYCTMIQVASKQLEEEDGSRDSPLFDFIERCLCNRHEMVVYEAASAIVNLPGCSAKELPQLCHSPKPTLHYIAVHTLDEVAMKHPSAVTACNLDLGNLVRDSNHSIATLAITTLLKTGSESSIDRLMKQTSSFLSEISDELKVVVVQATSALCQKHPRKHAIFMNLLLTVLCPGAKQKALNAGYILNGLTVFVPDLERALHQYTLEPSEKPFGLKSVPLATTPMAEQRTEGTPITANSLRKWQLQEIFQEQQAAVPEFQGPGLLFKSSPESVALTESD
ncbi:hypothetical protein P7K49_037215 [Saguinus oedipus]|uniref:Clathrin/coatomer adaptor adaptin-like N-terminal domain-containing protein n=1 Tax=Saguinus oedipus TaxID=9490 RepID=A0ABQ9THF3_SAGOE|nr:hypothetical protein P7K49_037215 [Saguinus oedipus]